MTDRPTNAPRGLEDVLAEHVFREIEPACSCGWDWDYRGSALPSDVGFAFDHPRYPHNERPRQYRAHVAAAIREWLTSEAVVEAAAREICASVIRDNVLGGTHTVWTDWRPEARAALAAAAGVV